MIVIIFLFFAKQCKAGPGGQWFGSYELIFPSDPGLSAFKYLVLNVKDCFSISNTP